jgi:hypothetical protein
MRLLMLAGAALLALAPISAEAGDYYRGYGPPRTVYVERDYYRPAPPRAVYVERRYYRPPPRPVYVYRQRRNTGAAIGLGIMAGALAGAAIAAQPPAPVYHDPGYGYRDPGYEYGY